MEEIITYGCLPEGSGTGYLHREPHGFDWIAGIETGILYNDILGGDLWDSYIPDPERQRKRTETMACVSFSALNIVEIQLNRMMAKNQLPMDRLSEFLDSSGKFNFSDRFTAKMSGTTDRGNYLTSVWDSIRHHGIIPESDWPFAEGMTWDDYYSEIPQELKDKAKKILDILDFSYEYVLTGQDGQIHSDIIDKHLKQAPLQLAVSVCETWNSNLVNRCNSNYYGGHAIVLYGFDKNSEWKICDTYDPYGKSLVWDYPFLCALKGVVSLKKDVTFPQPFSHKFTSDIHMWSRSPEVAILQNALKIGGCFPLTVESTGLYGPVTQQAVLKFQIKYKIAPESELLSVNGKKVGPKTRNKLNQLFA